MEERFRLSNKQRHERPLVSMIFRIIRITIAFFVFGIVSFSYAVYFFISPPSDFKTHSFFTIEEGMTFDQIARSLKEEGYIRSKIGAKIIHRVIFLQGNGAIAGEYFFEERLSLFNVIKMIDSGNYNSDLIKITIPEGLNKYETAEILSKKLSGGFDTEVFLKLANEGYIFPDTYFLTAKTDTEEIIKIMRNNFDDKIKEILPDIEKTGRSLEDIIIMASIVETEARQFETRRIVADVLWKRIDQGFPLQVDVSFKYINGKTTFDLTLDDLAIDSPYNTYKYAGFPPTPIANPGLDSIRATITPEKTDYLYFLTGQDGIMYYGKDFEEHKKNRELYLQ